MNIQKLYLDTHVLIWLYDQGVTRFTDLAIECLEAAQELLISPIVLLEIEYLYEIGRITQPSSVITHYLFEHLALSVCSKPFHQVVAKALEVKWTRDPFDRLITAQANLDQDPLLTKDPTIQHHYPHAVW